MTSESDSPTDSQRANHQEILAQLSNVLESRKAAAPDSSYVASLYAKGLNKILEKVGEEATEVVLAARDLAQGEPQNPASDTRSPPPAKTKAELESALVGEVADLWFHSMVMLSHQGIASGKVLDELGERFGVSGIVEKNSREKNSREKHDQEK